MIELPKKIKQLGNKCVASCITMVAMYWRKERADLNWQLPDDLESVEWKNFLEDGCKRIGSAGLPEPLVDDLLTELEIPLRADYLPLTSVDDLIDLIEQGIPPIPNFDKYYFFKGLRVTGHNIVLVDYTKELLVGIDSENAPRFETDYSIRKFTEAWEKRGKYIIYLAPFVLIVHAKVFNSPYARLTS